MKRHFSALLSIFLLFSLIAVAGCGPSSPAVTITYHQVGACNGYQGPNGLVSVGTNQAYVIFGIERIDNTQRTSSFAFDPTRLFFNGTIRDFFDPSLAIYHDILGPFAAVSTTVSAGQNYGFNPSAYGALVAQTANPNGAVEANNTAYFLNYNTQSSDPPITLVKSDSNRTTWPNTEDCHTITLQ
jgi:hypothetical protein